MKGIWQLEDAARAQLLEPAQQEVAAVMVARGMISLDHPLVPEDKFLRVGKPFCHGRQLGWVFQPWLLRASIRQQITQAISLYRRVHADFGFSGLAIDAQEQLLQIDACYETH